MCAANALFSKNHRKTIENNIILFSTLIDSMFLLGEHLAFRKCELPFLYFHIRMQGIILLNRRLVLDGRLLESTERLVFSFLTLKAVRAKRDDAWLTPSLRRVEPTVAVAAREQNY